MTDLAIEARGLVKRFGDNVALDGVDLEVPQGSDLRAARPERSGQDHDGAGPHHAAATRRRSGLRRRRRRHGRPARCPARIGLTGQYAAVEERLTGRENIEFVGRLFHLPDDRGQGRGPPSCSTGSISSTPATGSSRLLRRDAPPARHRHEPDRPAVGAVPRRTHDRSRPPEPARACGS